MHAGVFENDVTVRAGCALPAGKARTGKHQRPCGFHWEPFCISCTSNVPKTTALVARSVFPQAQHICVCVENYPACCQGVSHQMLGACVACLMILFGCCRAIRRSRFQTTTFRGWHPFAFSQTLLQPSTWYVLVWALSVSFMNSIHVVWALSVSFMWVDKRFAGKFFLVPSEPACLRHVCAFSVGC